MVNDAFDATARVLLSEFAGKQLPLMQQLVWLSEFAGKQWQTMPLMLQFSCAAFGIRWQTMVNDALYATARVLLSEFAGKQWQTMPLMLQFVSGCPNSLANDGKRCR
ncbi:unnamed protein product [Cylicocyclus nassatus]|uniref:Uncharacterized protein n=1 Tax=Cylicocyclus nassatus TaxID=53992 RepID=A0AA36DT51_CYLNA|nr:unnamed protein product [Cylicocyclus nassatus]